MSSPSEPPLPRVGRAGEPCHACSAPLAFDQRYCLECGARRGAGGAIDFEPLIARAPAPVIRTARSHGLLAFPLPVAATMLIALLVAGIMLGSLGSPQSSASSAADGLRVLMAAQQPAPATTPVPPADPTAPAISAQTPAASSTPTSSAPGTSAPADSGASTTGGGQTSGGSGGHKTSGTTDPASPIKHVFVIMLAEQAQPDAFATGSAAPYLSGTLVPSGTLLRGMRPVGTSGLANSIALLSGQGPNAQTLAGCPVYADIAPGTIGKDSQEQGAGCVYSVQTPTLANQLDQQGLSWRAYVEDQRSGGAGAPAACRHPTLGAPDPWRDARPGDPYATARNPFVYFHAVTDSKTCDKTVADYSSLEPDLAADAADVPALSYIVPNLCHDGRATPCAPGAPAGVGAADAFLADLVPKIQRSKAYADSLIIVTFERGFAAPPAAPGYEMPAPTGPAVAADQVGALLVSPAATAGKTVTTTYDSYSLLAMIEDIFTLDHLGLAAGADVKHISAGLLH